MDIEDVRPEQPSYVETPRKQGLTFPWMALLAIALAGAMIGGALIYLRTVQAWNDRHTPQTHAAPRSPSVAEADAMAKADADREMRREQIRQQLQRLNEASSMEAQRLKEAQRQHEMKTMKGWRCIDHVQFRPLPGGGWENVPGVSCEPGSG